MSAAARNGQRLPCQCLGACPWGGAARACRPTRPERSLERLLGFEPWNRQCRCRARPLYLDRATLAPKTPEWHCGTARVISASALVGVRSARHLSALGPAATPPRRPKRRRSAFEGHLHAYSSSSAGRKSFWPRHCCHLAVKVTLTLTSLALGPLWVRVGPRGGYRPLSGVRPAPPPPAAGPSSTAWRFASLSGPWVLRAEGDPDGGEGQVHHWCIG